MVVDGLSSREAENHFAQMPPATGLPASSGPSRSLLLNGARWALNSSLRDLDAACRGESGLTYLKLDDCDLDTLVAGKCVKLLQKHAASLQHITLYESTGHVDLFLMMALTTLPKLTSLEIATGRLSVEAFDHCANALGVGLQGHQSLRKLTLQSGSNYFFALSPTASLTLADGLFRTCFKQRRFRSP